MALGWLRVVRSIHKLSLKCSSGQVVHLDAEFISPPKVYTFSFILGNIIPKSVKCVHSATYKFRLEIGLGGARLQRSAALVALDPTVQGH